MATVPDIDTANVDTIAYYNAIDNGASQVDPTTILTDSIINEYTQYDNGITGVATVPVDFGGRGLTAKFRVKSDGWFVCYFEDKPDYFGNSETDVSPFQGTYDLAHYSLSDTRNTPPITSLERVIQSLHQTSDASNAYDNNDVGHYNYNYEAAETILIAQDYAFNEFQGGSRLIDEVISYTSSVTNYYQVFFCTSNELGSYSLNGVQLYNGPGSNNDGYSAIDLDAQGVIPDSGVQYSATGSEPEQDMTYGYIFVFSG